MKYYCFQHPYFYGGPIFTDGVRLDNKPRSVTIVQAENEYEAFRKVIDLLQENKVSFNTITLTNVTEKIIT